MENNDINTTITTEENTVREETADAKEDAMLDLIYGTNEGDDEEEKNTTIEPEMEKVDEEIKPRRKRVKKEEDNLENESKPVINAKKRRANPDDITQEEMDYIYERRRALMQAPSLRRTYYREEEAVTYRQEEEVIGDKGEERAESMKLMSAVSSPTPVILEGYVVGYSRTTTDKIPMVLVDFQKDAISFNQIKIPAAHFLFYNHKEYDSPEGAIHLRSLLQSFIGAKIYFVVFEYNEKSHIAYASRLQAMDILSHFNYRKPQSRFNGEPNLVVDRAAKATVVSVMRDRIIVDVCGADITMRSKDLSWSTTGPLTACYKVGDTFKVKVTEVKEEQKVQIGSKTYRRQPVTVSRRPVMRAPSDLYYDYYNVGDTVMAIITSENTTTGVFVNLQGKMPALCYTLPTNPIPNSRCQVLITAKHDDTRQINGRIIPGTVTPPTL